MRDQESIPCARIDTRLVCWNGSSEGLPFRADDKGDAMGPRSWSDPTPHLTVCTLAGAIVLLGWRTVPHNVGHAVFAPGDMASSQADLLDATPTGSVGDAELGAEVYCHHCATCHGDRGQGLIPEYRMSFPPELQGCWDTGCHGDDQGHETTFVLPASVPAIVWDGMGNRFESASALQAYLYGRMPFHDPESLTLGELDGVAAFLASENDLTTESTTVNPPETQLPISTVDGRASAAPVVAWMVSVTPPSPVRSAWLAALVGLGAAVGIIASALARRRRGEGGRPPTKADATGTDSTPTPASGSRAH